MKPVISLLSFLLLPALALAIFHNVLPPSLLILYYPVAISLIIGSSFIFSYFNKHCLVQRIALQQEPNIPAEGLSYCRKVNHCWSIFLLINAGIALYLAQSGDLRSWAVYCGGISYALMGTLFAVEWFFRRRVKRKIETAEVAQQLTS